MQQESDTYRGNHALFLEDLGNTTLDDGGIGSWTAAMRWDASTVIDVRAFLAPGLRALHSHHLFRVLPPDLCEEVLGREYFVRARPREAPTDWLLEVVSAARSEGQS